jgi:pSer/pThr/pTyr-binding forkhead associated (FHA) protein
LVDVHYYIEYLGNSVELPLGETVVGRDVGCKLRFNDPSVSRRHLRFIRRADELFVEDLQSSNGTKLNGRTVEAPTPLADGDAISVGGRTLFVRITDSESPSSSTTLNLAELPSDSRTLRARTMPHAAVTVPPVPQHRCPNCGSVVSDTDAECKTCRNPLSRPAARTGVTQRRHDRHVVGLHILYVSNELEIEATSRDLSPTGVFVCTQVLDPVGTRCTLTFLLDGGPPLRIDGIVRRVVAADASPEPSGLGVEFSRVGAQERTWLAALIARFEPKATAGS